MSPGGGFPEPPSLPASAFQNQRSTRIARGPTLTSRRGRAAHHTPPPWRAEPSFALSGPRRVLWPPGWSVANIRSRIVDGCGEPQRFSAPVAPRPATGVRADPGGMMSSAPRLLRNADPTRWGLNRGPPLTLQILVTGILCTHSHCAGATGTRISSSSSV
jgi:hypothetical protein